MLCIYLVYIKFLLCKYINVDILYVINRKNIFIFQVYTLATALYYSFQHPCKKKLTGIVNINVD